MTRRLTPHDANFYQQDVGSSFRARIHASVGHMSHLRRGLCRKLVRRNTINYVLKRVENEEVKTYEL